MVIRRRLVAFLVLVLVCAGLVVSAANPASASAGETWTARSAPAQYWNSVTFGNGTFVAVGSRAVMTSTNGVDWTERTAAGPGYWRSVTYGNGLFVAVGNLAQTCGFMPWDPCVPDVGAIQIMTSPDGVTWTARTAPEANSWLSVTYGNGVFVAVTDDGTNRVMTSPDGVTWTARAGSVSKTWQSVAFGNGTFVAASVNDIPIGLMTSTDGVNWTTQSGVANTNFLGFGNGNFVALKGEWDSGLLTSPDGSTWTPRSAANGNSWKSAVYGDGLWVAVAPNGTDRVMTSPDAITWTARSAAEANQWSSVTYGNGVFVAVSPNGTNRVMTSGVYVPPISVPAAPTSLVATPGNGSASIAFTAGADGGAAITKYQYKVGSGSWTDAVGTTSPITITGLTNYATVSIRLRAVNSVGAGAASTFVQVWPRIAGSSLTSVRAQGTTALRAAFAALTPVGGTVSHYWVYAYAKGTNTLVSSCRSTAAARGCLIERLVPNTEYDVAVRGFFTLTGSPTVLPTTDSARQTVRTRS